MHRKKRFYKWIELFTIIGLVCLIHGMALTGSLYYTDNYTGCYEHDRQMAAEDYAVKEAEFDNFRMMLYFGEEIPRALVSMQATVHTNEIGFWLHRIYATGRVILWSGTVICLLAFLVLRRRKRYKVLRKGVMAALTVPFVLLVFGLVVRFSAVKNWIACIFLSRYDRVFYDDKEFVSILPRGIFLGYVRSYLLIWLAASAVFLIVYYTKKKHRRPYEF